MEKSSRTWRSCAGSRGESQILSRRRLALAGRRAGHQERLDDRVGPAELDRRAQVAVGLGRRRQRGVDGHELGDTTTLADPSVVAAIAEGAADADED